MGVVLSAVLDEGVHAPVEKRHWHGPPQEPRIVEAANVERGPWAFFAVWRRRSQSSLPSM